MVQRYIDNPYLIGGRCVGEWRQPGGGGGEGGTGACEWGEGGGRRASRHVSTGGRGVDVHGQGQAKGGGGGASGWKGSEPSRVDPAMMCFMLLMVVVAVAFLDYK